MRPSAARYSAVRDFVVAHLNPLWALTNRPQRKRLLNRKTTESLTAEILGMRLFAAS
jgi:hypothetical protein